MCVTGFLIVRIFKGFHSKKIYFLFNIIGFMMVNTMPLMAAPINSYPPVRLYTTPTGIAKSPDRFVSQAIPVGNQIRRTLLPSGDGVSFQPIRVISPFWQKFQSGAYNAITDVPGIKIGHLSVYGESPSKIRTGVTAIVPDAAWLTQNQGNLATTGFRAAGITLNGNGELTGMGPLTTAGILNSPIILTNTFSVGAAHQGVFEYYAKYHPGQWTGQLPVVGECWDGFYNTIENPVLTPKDTLAAIESAHGGPVPQGRVGAGTGMRAFEMHAGIGSASRKIRLNGHDYTIGVLVNANHSKLNDMNPLQRTALERLWGMPLEQMKILDNQDKAVRPPLPSPRQGSIMTVIATDLPLDSKALHQLAERAGLGIGNTGSTMATSSGDFAVAFSTNNPVPLGNDAPDVIQNTTVHPDALSPILQATVEAVTEAQLNAIVASHTIPANQKYNT
jgi:D-aminopeptidase